ncbi:MAG: YjjG family noncanonical pyrimidine nucleotidase [Oscillospiraceae bacterium]
MIKAVLLDSDDTLLDFTKAERIALTKTLLELGIEPADETVALYSRINKAHWEMLERGELTRAQVLTRRFERLFEALGVSGDAAATQKIYEAYLSQGHYFIPGAEELLETLHGHYALYLVSNGNARVQDSRLKSAGIGHWFEEIFISERVGFDKPRPEFFERCFARMPPYEKGEMLIIGDSLTSDIRGGLNAGIHTCWFNPQGRPGREDILPEYTVSSLTEIPALLQIIK